MLSLRGSRKRKTEQIIQKFLRSYAENEKSQDKKDLKTWLVFELQNELPNKKVEDIEKIATELIEGIEVYYTKKKEVEKYQSLGITNGDYVGNEILEKVADEIEEAEIVDIKEIIEDMKEVSNILSQYNEAMIYETAAIKEPQLVANILSTNSVNNYVDTINTAIDNANKTVIESITTKAGTINQNPNLDGFIFEEHHAGTFNIDAAVKQKSYHAEALKPELGETYGKNSIDIVIEDSGKVINEYQAKAYKNANKTAKAFNDKNGYKYVGQLKLVPTDQTRKIVNSLDKIKYNNVESKGITKTEIKEIQNDLQSRNIKRNIFDFKKDVNTISIIKQIGKQAMVNGTIGLGIGITTNIGINLINGKEVEAEQVIETGIKTGVSMGMATAIAGGIRVAVEKKVIPTVFSRILTNNTIGAIAAASMDILGTAFKLGSGEISLDRAMKDIGILISSVYSTIISSNIAYEGTKLIMGMVGMGTMGGVGTLIITVVSVVLRVVFRTVGSKFCNTITNGLERIREKTICESLEVVKDGAASIKNMAFGIIDKYKKIGEKLIPDALK
jgi:PE-PGRS family protein